MRTSPALPTASRETRSRLRLLLAPLAATLLLFIGVPSVPREASAQIDPAAFPNLALLENPAHRAKLDTTTSDWTETKIGTVPNSFGQLFTVAGVPTQYSLVFQNARRELRVIEVAGRLPSNVFLIDRNAGPTSTEEAPDSGSKEEAGSGQIVEEDWTVDLIGSIPARFGKLESLSGSRGEGGGYTLVFRDDDDNLRIVLWKGNRLQKEAYLYTIDALEPSLGTPIGDSRAQRSRTADPEPDGWSDVPAGSIPEHFGKLIASSSNDQRTTFVFENPLGDLRVFEFQPGQAPQAASLILRSNPDAEELRGRKQEDKERRKKGFDWKVSLAGVLPDSYGVVHRIDSQNQLAFVLLDPENQLRIVNMRGNRLRENVALIERPAETGRKRRTDGEGWKETPIGAIPETFGSLRAVTGTSESPLQLLCVFQGDAGEIRIVHRTGTRLPNLVDRIDLEY